MKILVTGGTGRIGANLVTRLLAKGHDIRTLVYPVMPVAPINWMPSPAWKR